jgi:hypothetical protein
MLRQMQKKRAHRGIGAVAAQHRRMALGLELAVEHVDQLLTRAGRAQKVARNVLSFYYNQHYN